MSTHLNTCSICLDDISVDGEEQITTLKCNHSFHTKCISQLRSNKCPGCRTRFTNIPPEMLSKIQQRESADTVSRNTEENLDVILNNFITFENATTTPPGGPLATLGLIPPPTTTMRVSLINHPDRDKISFLLQNITRTTLSAPPPSPCSTLSDVVSSLLSNVAPTLATLLNTPFQGVTLNSMLEDYIVRNI